MLRRKTKADFQAQFTWAQEDLSLLQQYRAAHRMETPSAFNSIRNQFLLSNPGIGRQSPTMARRKAKRKVPKEQLAMAVRKNFNDAAVNEIDVMVDLLYKVRNQGMSSCNAWCSLYPSADTSALQTKRSVSGRLLTEVISEQGPGRSDSIWENFGVHWVYHT